MNAFMFAHFGIIEFWTFLLGTIFIVLLPGPNSMYVLSVAARRGVRAGYQGACGVFLGDAILMVLSAAGVSSLLKASPVLFYVVKSIGAAYLAWIGLQMLRGAVRNWRARKAGGSAEQNAARGDESHPFKKALVISLLNPKAILFFISFFIQFVDPHFALPALSFVVLGLVCQIGSFLYLTTIIFVGARLAAAFRARRRLAAGMSSGVGAMFIGFSAKLATATLN
ncbi:MULTISPECIES: leucine efflux protein LeuE [Ralstonia solanacearum species complex]|uniref:Leucine efflux protein LeuE n=4 Tax=Ralstonia solanacearum species complex TaxID=3116862 RepID=A0A0K1ZKC5_RALSL|nr:MULTISPECIES: leucine efflux protein LeuE [Ralstonia]AKZ26491.1 membrane protein [Ralstonia solanacearum]APC68728.1 leucine efflux protein LeuE [Ralstonia solanacearum OE1-1]AGH84357.1 L-lysine permease [Ralstonia pseudosolanacearum FQY_4]ANH32831.1 L-lysine permease [Ralstonia solanacearum]API74549.1 leucine efflux protein LeuE [Ralstonia pseudosolanacearum]